MVFELHDTSRVKHLFDGWPQTLIWSCLQKVMGTVYVTDIDKPLSAFAFVGCFGFLAGAPNRELVANKPAGFVILVPRNSDWAELIETVYPDAKKVTRYAIKKDTRFDVESLKGNLQLLPDGYELKRIDDAIYDKCLENPVTADFVSAFKSKRLIKVFVGELLQLEIGGAGEALCGKHKNRLLSGSMCCTYYRQEPN